MRVSRFMAVLALAVTLGLSATACDGDDEQPDRVVPSSVRPSWAATAKPAPKNVGAAVTSLNGNGSDHSQTTTPELRSRWSLAWEYDCPTLQHFRVYDSGQLVVDNHAGANHGITNRYNSPGKRQLTVDVPSACNWNIRVLAP